MKLDTRELQSLTKAQISLASESFAGTFRDYPVSIHYYPDEMERKSGLTVFFEFLLHYCHKYGEVYTTSPDLEGVAAWLPSEYFPMTNWRILRSVPIRVVIDFFRGGNGQMSTFSETIDEAHARLVPFRHYFLQVIGVDPIHQGKGLASKLIRPILERLDEENLPCYLETLDYPTVPIYEHFGFQVLEEIRIPGTDLKNWSMLRKPRRPGRI